MVGSHRRRRRPGICCSHTAAAAALEQGSRGTVKKRGEKIQSSTWKCCTEPPYPTHWTEYLGFLFQSTIPIFSLVQINSVAHPHLLSSVILWIILPSTAVVQTRVQGKGLGLPPPAPLANAVLLGDDGKCPVLALYSGFRGSKINNSELPKSSHLNKMFQHSYVQYVALRGMSQLVIFSHFFIYTDLYFTSQACMSQHRACWLL